MRVSQEYLILSVTTRSGKVVNLRGHNVRFRPVSLYEAQVSPAVAGKRVRIKNIRYRIRAQAGRFVKIEHFRHPVDCDLTWMPGRKFNRMRSNCGPLFERMPLNDILESRKFGNTKGVQFVA